jgi:hypothetical protein
VADVGADIESLCRKCGDVWHVVVAKVGTKIAKVQCKQCGGLHRYRPPDGVAVPRASRPSRAKASRSSRSPSKPTSNSPLVEADPNKPLRPYRINETFSPGDRLSHRSFGEGVVEMVVGPQKIQVFFPGGRKVLAHER